VGLRPALLSPRYFRDSAKEQPAGRRREVVGVVRSGNEISRTRSNCSHRDVGATCLRSALNG